MYKGKEFRVRSPEEIAAHLRRLADVFGTGAHRVFLADGDALVMDTPAFLAAMAQVRGAFPDARRFAAYGSVFSLADKTADDLLRLKAAGLRTVYLGLESGDEETLRRVDKYMAAPRMAEICRRVVAAGLNLSLMVVIGLGGRSRSRLHAEASAGLVNAIGPSHTSLLSLLLEHTPLAADADYRDFSLSDYFTETAAFVAAVAMPDDLPRRSRLQSRRPRRGAAARPRAYPGPNSSGPGPLPRGLTRKRQGRPVL